MKITITYLVIELAFQRIPVCTGRVKVWQGLRNRGPQSTYKTEHFWFSPSLPPLPPPSSFSFSLISLLLLPQIVIDAVESK